MLGTSRLILREWKWSDREPFAKMNTDPRVMEYFPGPLSRAESDAMVDRIEAVGRESGLGPLAAELRETGEFIRSVGLLAPSFDAHFTPCVEIGWRLAFEHWGRGYATEGGLAVLDHGFEAIGLHEIVSFTTAGNLRSRRVMERLGMARDPGDDFDHPRLREGHPLRRHVLYRIGAGLWASKRGAHPVRLS